MGLKSHVIHQMYSSYSTLKILFEIGSRVGLWRRVG